MEYHIILKLQWQLTHDIFKEKCTHTVYRGRNDYDEYDDHNEIFCVNKCIHTLLSSKFKIVSFVLKYSCTSRIIQLRANIYLYYVEDVIWLKTEMNW